jgi:hypothetical protein
MRNVFIMWALLFMVPVAAQEDVTEEESLRGLKQIQLVVENLPADSEAFNLSKGIIELEVTQQLQAANIEVLSLEDRKKHPRRPYIYINCNLIYVEELGLVSYSIDVEVHQRVTLETGKKAQALTWAKSYLGLTGTNKASQRIRSIVKDYVRIFTQQVNKKPGGLSDA